jgi:hypothetical protein
MGFEALMDLLDRLLHGFNGEKSSSPYADNVASVEVIQVIEVTIQSCHF